MRAVSSAAVNAAVNATMNAAVLAAEQQRAAALVARDPAALAGWLHPDLVDVHATGTRHDRAQLLRFVAEGPRFLAVAWHAPAVELHGGVALLYGALRLRLQRQGETATTDACAWASAVWLLGPAGWQLRLFQLTRQETEHG